MLPNLPRGEQPTFLNAGDVSVISFICGMTGVSVPSRMYNVSAAGKPVIAVADDDSELAPVVREERVGWVVTPDDPVALCRAIDGARQAGNLADMGRRTGRLVETTYTLERAVKRSTALIQRLA